MNRKKAGLGFRLNLAVTAFITRLARLSVTLPL
jgi:hypothetical protein